MINSIGEREHPLLEEWKKGDAKPLTSKAKDIKLNQALV